MKIIDVEAIPVSYPEPNDNGALRHLCLVKVTGDDGEVGWGESITLWPEASLATAHVIDGLRPLVLGADPVQSAAIWYAMKQHVWWYGHRGGIASYAISAIDIAIWDLKGKALGRSVLDLLGGPLHDELPAIASCHAFKSDISAMAAEMAGWLTEGLHGVKVGFGKRGNAQLGFEHERDVAFVRALRAEIGPQKSLMVDLGQAIRWDVSTAVRRTRAFEEYGLTWIEEPLGPWDVEGYRTLRDKTSTLIAYGEREWTIEGYEAVLETGTVDVVGIDPARAEGITGFRRITRLVESQRRQANAHAWSSAITTAASLALSFNSSACKVFELKPLSDPMQHELVEVPIAHVGGNMHPLTGPGLGIAVREEVVDHYRCIR